MATIIENHDKQLQMGTDLLTDITRQANRYFKKTGSTNFDFPINAPCEFEDWWLIVKKDEKGNIEYMLNENNEIFQITVYEAIDLCITHLIHSKTVI